MLSCHRRHSASRLPCSLMAGPRGVDACWAASIRATWRTAALTGSPCLDQGGEPPAGWHPAHRHQVIAYLASRVAYLRDPQVHIGGEPPVELGLALARRRACFRRAEIQEAEVDRLLQLVRAITGEEHHGRMRFRDIRVGLMRRPGRHQVVALSHFIITRAHVPGQDRSAAGPHVLVRWDSCPQTCGPPAGPGWRMYREARQRIVAPAIRPGWMPAAVTRGFRVPAGRRQSSGPTTAPSDPSQCQPERDRAETPGPAARRGDGPGQDAYACGGPSEDRARLQDSARRATGWHLPDRREREDKDRRGAASLMAERHGSGRAPPSGPEGCRSHRMGTVRA